MAIIIKPRNANAEKLAASVPELELELGLGLDLDSELELESTFDSKYSLINADTKNISPSPNEKNNISRGNVLKITAIKTDNAPIQIAFMANLSLNL